MSTYRELTSMILDELKLVSDDSYFVEEHIVFLLDKYRSFILKQRYSDLRKEIPESNYQTICIDLEKVINPSGVADCFSNTYLKSTSAIPMLMPIGKRDISTIDFFIGNINYVNNSRFKYTGHNKYLKNQSYGTIAPDKHLYLKSSNPQFYHLSKVRITGIFENASSTVALQCGDDKASICDTLDMVFPLEESLIPPVIELIVKELSAFKYQAQDSLNNANDDLSNLAAYIRQQVAEGRRSDLYKNP